MGEPRRDNLEHLRYLRQELDAFAQVQERQITVLGSLLELSYLKSAKTSTAEPDENYAKGSFALHRCIEDLKEERGNIQNLDGLLDDLHSEVLTSQDDSLAVVFF